MPSHRSIPLDQVFELLPEVEDLLPLRAALVEAAGIDPGRRWAASDEYRLLESRLLDPESLRSTAARLADEVARRTHRVFGHVAEAIARAGEGDHRAAALALIRAGEVEEYANRPGRAERYYLKAMETGRRSRDRTGEGLALRRLGRVARSAGSLRRAETFYRESLAIAEAMHDAEAIIAACQGIGNVLGDQERWPDARRWYERGLETLSSGLPEHLLWQLQVNLSVVSRKSGDLAESRNWLTKAHDTAARAQDPGAAPYIHNAEGLLLQAEGDAAGAEAIFRTALLETGVPAERATFLVNLADNLVQQGRLVDARTACRRLEELAAASALTAFLPYVYRTMGRISALERDEDGFVFFEQALSLSAAPVAAPHEEALTQREYARYEAAFGRLEAAVARLDLAGTIYRRIGAAMSADQIEAERATFAERLASEPGA